MISIISTMRQSGGGKEEGREELYTHGDSLNERGLKNVWKSKGVTEARWDLDGARKKSDGMLQDIYTISIIGQQKERL